MFDFKKAFAIVNKPPFMVTLYLYNVYKIYLL